MPRSQTMVVLTDSERQLLERLAAEGKRTRLALGELQVAKSLEADGLVFMIRDTLDAVITPKGRNVLVGIQISARPPGKRPPSFFS